MRVLVCRRSCVRESYSAKHSWSSLTTCSLALKNSSSKSRRSPAELVQSQKNLLLSRVFKKNNNNNKGVGLLQLPINQRSSHRSTHRSNLQLNIFVIENVHFVSQRGFDHPLPKTSKSTPDSSENGRKMPVFANCQQFGGLHHFFLR